MVPIIHLLPPSSKQIFNFQFYDKGTGPSKWFSFATGAMYTETLIMMGVGGTLQEEETSLLIPMGFHLFSFPSYSMAPRSVANTQRHLTNFSAIQ